MGTWGLGNNYRWVTTGPNERVKVLKWVQGERDFEFQLFELDTSFAYAHGFCFMHGAINTEYLMLLQNLARKIACL